MPSIAGWLLDILQQSSYKINEDFQVISISIDPKETNENLKNHQKKYLSKLNVSHGWLFLKGSVDQIELISKNFWVSL